MKALLSFCAVVTVLAGSARAQFTGDTQRFANDLKQIGLAYHNYNDSFGKAPTKAEDLGPFIENDKRLMEVLKEKVVFIYGVKITEMPAGTSNTVLAYQKDIEKSNFGVVLMGDGSIKKMTPDEFKKATLAKPK
jgi:hypothetical protein